MADLRNLNFDANNVDPDVGFEPIPAGEYDVHIASSELKETKAGTGHYLDLEFQVLNGEYQNRKLFEKLNLYNPNPKAVTIAKGQLSAICRAIGIMTPEDSSELHGRPLRVSVKVTHSEQYGNQNKITKYSSRAVQPVQQQTATASAPTEPAAGADPFCA
jgi:hypothetical protein